MAISDVVHHENTEQPSLDNESALNREIVETYFTLFWGFAENYIKTERDRLGSTEAELQATLDPEHRARLEQYMEDIADYLQHEGLMKDAYEAATLRVYRDCHDIYKQFDEVPNKFKYDYLLLRYQELEVQNSCSEMESSARGFLVARHAASNHRDSSDSDDVDAWVERQNEFDAREDNAQADYRHMCDYYSSGLVFHDAHQRAVDKIGRLHKEIADIHNWEYSYRLEWETRANPVRAYDMAVKDYASRYAGLLGHDLAAAMEELKDRLSTFNAHRDDKPASSASQKMIDAWKEVDLELTASVDKSSSRVMEIERLRMEAAKGLTPLTLAWGKEQVAERHPELDRRAREKRDDRRGEANREHLERQTKGMEGQEAEKGTTGGKGLGR